MRLTTEGIIFVTLAWGIIITLVTYCFVRVFRSERKINKK
jgi:hypothetical protein